MPIYKSARRERKLFPRTLENRGRSSPEQDFCILCTISRYALRCVSCDENLNPICSAICGQNGLHFSNRLANCDISSHFCGHSSATVYTPSAAAHFTKLKASKAASYLGKTDCVRFRGRSGPNSPNVFFCQLPTQVRRHTSGLVEPRWREERTGSRRIQLAKKQ